ncbi:MAG: hypothetical protein ACREDO_02390 [Methyloceanibacter sp.]
MIPMIQERGNLVRAHHPHGRENAVSLLPM